MRLLGRVVKYADGWKMCVLCVSARATIMAEANFVVCERWNTANLGFELIFAREPREKNTDALSIHPSIHPSPSNRVPTKTDDANTSCHLFVLLLLQPLVVFWSSGRRVISQNEPSFIISTCFATENTVDVFLYCFIAAAGRALLGTAAINTAKNTHSVGFSDGLFSSGNNQQYH